jgi:hypothetical protein
MIAGLGISFVGTVLVALSIKQGKVVFWKDSPKEQENTAVFRVGLFRWGLILLGVGFLFQIVSVASKKG